MSFGFAQIRWSNLSLALIACFGVLSVSCSKAGPTSTNNTSTVETYSTSPPFPTKEPDTYQAVRKLTFTDSDGNSKTVQTQIARSGELRRETNEAASQPIVYLDSSQGSFVLLPRQKVYAETNGDESETAAEASEEGAERRVHTEPVKVKYQKLGTEVFQARTLTKYKIVNTSSDGTVSNGETVIWVDESLGMPVKSESSSNDKSRTMMELTNISLEVDKKLFELPADYQKIAIIELRRRLLKE